MTEHIPHTEHSVAEIKPMLSKWIAEMRARDEWPETDLSLMQAIEDLLTDHDRLFEQLEALQAGLQNIRRAAIDRENSEGADFRRGWISASWVEDTCRMVLERSNPAKSRENEA